MMKHSKTTAKKSVLNYSFLIKVVFPFNVSHLNTLCVSLMSGKHDEHIFFLIKTHQIFGADFR